jgi:hypothetical protein
MKYIKLLLFVPLLMAFQCDDDIEISDDSLNDTSLLGRWEINSEVMNGKIMDLLPKCCKFIEFSTDEKENDLIGMYIYTEDMDAVSSGVFTVNLNSNTIVFEPPNSQIFTYEFMLNNNASELTFNFTENGVNFQQTWIKRN